MNYRVGGSFVSQPIVQRYKDTNHSLNRYKRCVGDGTGIWVFLWFVAYVSQVLGSRSRRLAERKAPSWPLAPGSGF